EGFALGLGALGEDDEEFVAAAAEGEILLADAGADELADAAEEGVTGGVAEGVVEELEIVDVDHEEAEGRAILAAAVDELVEAFVEHAAVEQAGEHVAGGLSAELADEAFEDVGALGDALVDLGLEAGDLRTLAAALA